MTDEPEVELADRLAEWPKELRRGARADGGFLGSPPPITPEQAEALAGTLDEAVEALRECEQYHLDRRDPNSLDRLFSGIKEIIPEFDDGGTDE